MRSLAESHGQYVDIRELQFSGTFFALPENTADAMLKEVYQFINEQFGCHCILDWKAGSRVLKDYDNIASRKMENGAYIIALYGNVLCKQIYNKTTFREFEKDKTKFTSSPPVPLKKLIRAVDYEEYYEKELAPYFDSETQAKNAILNLMNLEVKTPRGPGLKPDMHALFSSAPMEKNSLFYGDFILHISSYCLEDDLDYWAERLCEFGKELLRKYAHTNIYIELNPDFGYVYSGYFGQYPSQSDPILHETPVRDYVRNIYVTEIGWAHLMCRETRELQTADPDMTDIFVSDDNVIEEELEGGGLFVRVRKPISAAGIQDYKAIKRRIYGMVMPRSYTLRLPRTMREHWQIVPVFDD